MLHVTFEIFLKNPTNSFWLNPKYYWLTFLLIKIGKEPQHEELNIHVKSQESHGADFKFSLLFFWTDVKVNETKMIKIWH